MREVQIASRLIRKIRVPFVIAEMSNHHYRSLDRARQVVNAAAKSGAHGLKIRTFTLDMMTLGIAGLEFLISDTGNLWKGGNSYVRHGVGRVSYAASATEEMSRMCGRSRYIVRDIKANEIHNESGGRAIRPGFDLSPKFTNMLRGVPETHDLSHGMALTSNAVLTRGAGK